MHVRITLLSALRLDDERDDVLAPFEADTVAGRGMLARKRTDAHAIPRAPVRNMSLENVGLVRPGAELHGKLFRFRLGTERADLELVAPFLPRR